MKRPIGKCRECKELAEVEFLTAPNYGYTGKKGFSVIVIAVCKRCGEFIDLGYVHLPFIKTDEEATM